MLQQSRLLLERVDETDTPAWIDGCPIELMLRFGIRAAADLGHHGYAGLADK